MFAAHSNRQLHTRARISKQGVDHIPFRSYMVLGCFEPALLKKDAPDLTQ